MSTPLFPGFAARAGLASDASLRQVVDAVQAMPYGRPGSRTPEGAAMPLACGDGQDFPASDDPAADKAALEARHCDPRAREPFIAALTLAAR